MKALFLVLQIFLCALLARAEDLTTIDKQTYQNFRVVKTNVDSIVIMHSQGGGTIYFTNLPPELQKVYGYDPAKAAEFTQKQEKLRKLGRLGAVYRLSQLKEAQEEARKEGKPLAFLASTTAALQGNASPMGKGSAAATIHVFDVLKGATVIVFSDSYTENHTEPPIVDAALHPPENTHYTPPKVVIVDAELTKVIYVVPYDTDSNVRAKLLGTALTKIREEKK